jgi:hypothetical protein
MHPDRSSPATESRAYPRPVALACALVFVLTCGAACERKRTPTGKLATASAAGSGQVLDGMQLDSARRVALQSAKAAIEARDLQRLKQLRKWVEGRASVPIFEADDLATLDIAIACLEQPAPSVEAFSQLERMKGSKLSEPARRLCQARARE